MLGLTFDGSILEFEDGFILSYSAAKVMPALASRAARDNPGLDDY